MMGNPTALLIICIFFPTGSRLAVVMTHTQIFSSGINNVN